MANGAAVAVQNAQVLEEQALRQEEESADREAGAAQVGVLDIDFLVVLLLAFFVDGLDIILELTAFLVVPKLFGILIDIAVVATVGRWIYKKSARKIEAGDRRRNIESRRQRLAQRSQDLHMRAGASRSSHRRIWFRIGAIFLGELIWLVGLIPFWTVAVWGVLRQK